MVCRYAYNVGLLAVYRTRFDYYIDAFRISLSSSAQSISHVQTCVMRAVVGIHNNFPKEDVIHQEEIYSRLSLDAPPIARSLCFSIAKLSLRTS